MSTRGRVRSPDSLVAQDNVGTARTRCSPCGDSNENPRSENNKNFYLHRQFYLLDS
jgi:hypothetical protein